MCIAYDATLNPFGSLDHMVARDADGNVTGLIDVEAHELAGGKLRDIWEVPGAAGSGTWPEWLGSAVFDFRVELGPDKRISALVHKVSGYRRERAAIEAAVAQRKAATPEGEPVDLRDILGGPNRPLILDDQGRTVGRSPTNAGTPAHLPIIGKA